MLLLLLLLLKLMQTMYLERVKFYKHAIVTEDIEFCSSDFCDAFGRRAPWFYSTMENFIGSIGQIIHLSNFCLNINLKNLDNLEQFVPFRQKFRSWAQMNSIWLDWIRFDRLEAFQFFHGYHLVV